MNKHLIFYSVVCFFLFVGLISSFYDDASKIDTLSIEDISQSIQNQQIDVSLIESDRLSEVLQSTPEISGRLSEDDLSRAVSSNLDLMDNDYIFSDVDRRTAENPSFLNDNQKIKQQWFKRFEITDEGAEITSYDGRVLTTSGSDSTTFNPRDFPKSKVLKSGKLVLEDGIELGSSKLTKSSDGTLLFNGGRVDLPEDFSKKVFVQDSELTFQNRIYSSTKKFSFQNDNGNLIISGESIAETDLTGKHLSDYSGEVTFLSNGGIQFGKDTKFSSYLDGKKDMTYYVKNPTKYLKQDSVCEAGSCINEFINADSKREIKVSARDNNYIYIGSPAGKSDDVIRVKEITDSSSVFYGSEDQTGKSSAQVEFRKKPFRVKGRVTDISPKIVQEITDENGVDHEIILEGGLAQQCSSPCREFSIINTDLKTRLSELKNLDVSREIVDEIRSEHGDQTADAVDTGYPRYLVQGSNPRIYKAAISASQQLYDRKGIYIDPEFIYTGAVAEGLGDMIAECGTDCGAISGYQYLGLDTFGSNAATLKKQGYLPQDFSGYSQEEHVNDAGMEVISANFRAVESAFVAKAAEYAYRRDIFLHDAQEMGIDTSKISNDALNFWTYVYYNSGTGKKGYYNKGGWAMLNSYNKDGLLTTDDYIWKKPTDSWKPSWTYANRRMANLEFLKKSGIDFPPKPN